MRNKLAVLLMFAVVVMLASCTSVTTSTTTTPAPPPVTATGVIVLCNAGAASGLNTAAIVVGNLQPNPIVEIPAVIDPGNTPAQVCQAISTAATKAGWTTNLSDPNSTGLYIYGPSDKIEIKCKNITLQFQTFGGGQTGPPTDCAPMTAVTTLQRDPAPIPVPCPANSPCKSIQIVTPDGINGTVSIVLGVPALEALVQTNAQILINASLPGNLTNTVSGPPGVEFQKGRVTLNQSIFDGTSPNCGAPPKPPCPQPPPLPTSNLTLRLAGIYEKDQYVQNYHPFPLPGHVSWDEKGWYTIGNFTLPVGVSFGIDSQVALPSQNLQMTFTETQATVILAVISPGATIPFSVNQTQAIKVPLVDSATAGQYPFLSTLSIKSVAVTQLDSATMEVDGTFGTPPVAPHHR